MEMLKRGAFVLFLSLFFAFGSVVMSFAVVEWSDIQYIEGNYSRIYFDYVGGRFHCINDWIVNQDDGGTSGGLNPGEYNKFTFQLNSVNYEIRIYQDGTATFSPTPLTNFTQGYTWATSPNEPTKMHTIWEFSFDVAPTTIRTFNGSDPPGGGIVVQQTPPPPSVVTSGPSGVPHVVDGEFTTWIGTPAPAPDPLRGYQSPVVDPWFHSGFDIELLAGGGVKVWPHNWTVPMPVPVGYNTPWLIFSAIFLMLAGGYLILRRVVQKS